MPAKLSPSRINKYAECERCYWLYVNKGLDRPSGPFPSLPGGMDDIIKEHFDRYRKRGELPPELDGKVDARLLEDQEFLENCRSWRREPRYEDPETGAILRGGVDDLLRAPDGSIVVLDYKTRGYTPKDEVPNYYSRQVNLYNLMLRENGYETKDYGYLLYYYPDDVSEAGEFSFHTELKRVPVDVDRIRRVFREAARLLDEPAPAPDEDCEFCQWSVEEHP